MAEELPWRLSAACNGISAAEADLAFDPLEEKQVEFVRRYCDRCPVTSACDTEGQAEPVPMGARAGLTEKQRGKLRPPRVSTRYGDLVRA